MQQSSARPGVPADLPSPLKPGTVEIVENTFTDVVRIDHLQLRQGTRPVITGSLRSTVDVAPTLRLDIEAFFYDSRGRCLGRATFAEEGHGEDQEEHAHTANQPTQLELRPQSPLGRPATSATLRVVQFITE